MPSQNPTFEYITTTNTNLDSKDAIFDATVVANYGDEGLDEDYHADILSRFIICAIESSNRTLTYDRYNTILVVVARPSDLWIQYYGGFINNPTLQQRVDNNQNVNLGPCLNYSQNVIPRINNPYQFGETIKIKLIKDTNFHYLYEGDTFFTSACNIWDKSSPNVQNYNAYHSQGIGNSYISNNFGAAGLQQKTIIPFASTNPALQQYTNGNQFYQMCINKPQYETFELFQYPDLQSQMISLFTNQANFPYYYSQNGGYYFINNFSAPLNFCKFEDINMNGKKRETTDSCIPNIIVTPNSFASASVRQTSIINYTPTTIYSS